MAAGVNVFRLNMSHGDQDTHARACEAARGAARDAGVEVGVLADLSGPKIRVGSFAEGAIDLSPGEPVTVTTRRVTGAPAMIPSQYARLHEELQPGARVLLDDGQLELRVEEINGAEVACRVVRGGRLRDRKGMNLPDSTLSVPALTEKDRHDARFAVDLGVEYVALSFVASAEDVRELRALLPERDPPLLIAKIERPQALRDIEAIVDAADGVMVARGDLGVEIPIEDVPVVQHELVALARARNRPCIVATQMLESMVVSAHPTRAEVSDVSTAVFAGADAVMLSAETASGAHPLAAVETMDRAARRVEAYLFRTRRFRVDSLEPLAGTASPSEALARATAQLSRDLRCRAIVVVGDGETAASARVIAAARPGAPIVVISASARAVAQATLVWGVVPVLLPAADLDAPHRCARREARRLGLAEPGEEILLVGAGEEGESGGADGLDVAVLTV